MKLVVMGVSGSGKTSVGLALSERLGIQFFDADDFHSDANKAKMSAKIPLTDSDRQPWLERLAQLTKEEKEFILACSCLKRSYREILTSSKPKGRSIRFIFLSGTKEVLQNRLADRKGHYMSPKLLQSQLDTLEVPDNRTEEVITVDITNDLERIVDEIMQKLMRELDS